MGETVELPSGRVEVEERPGGYLYMVEQGTLRSLAEVDQYIVAMEQLSARTGIRKALIDSRAAVPVSRDGGIRESLWKWLVSGRAFDQIAFVLDSEMQVTSVNMVALSERAGIRAFAAVHEAHRWLTGRSRTLSQTLTAPAGTGTPPGGVPSPSPGSGERRTSAPPRPSERPPALRRSSEWEIPAQPLPTIPRGSAPNAPADAPRSAGTTGRFDAARRPSERGIPAARKSDIVPSVRPDELPPRKKVDET